MFFIIFLLVYGLINSIFFIKLYKGFQLNRFYTVFALLLMILMIFAPFISRFAERKSAYLTAWFFEYVGFIWMGFIIIFFSTAVVMTSYLLILKITAVIFNFEPGRLYLSHFQSFLVTVVISFLICCYGYYEALNIKVEKLTLKTYKLPVFIEKIKIVQISDLHIGILTGGKRLSEIVKLIDSQNPDILVSTGDLFDGQGFFINEMAEKLNKIKTKYGKFAVTGNHEFYAGLENSKKFTEKAGFKMIDNDFVEIEDIINIAGVYDNAILRFDKSKYKKDIKILKRIKNPLYTVFLKHRPVVEEGCVKYFDLQLSGHSHKGQIFPFTLVMKVYFKYYTGLYELGPGKYIYTSRGTGTWGPPIRFLSPPEITVIEIVRNLPGSFQNIAGNL